MWHAARQAGCKWNVKTRQAEFRQEDSKAFQKRKCSGQQVASNQIIVLKLHDMNIFTVL